MPEQGQIFVGFKPIIFFPYFIKEIEVESNEFVNGEKWRREKFGWQDRYGIFSYSHCTLFVAKDKDVSHASQEPP